MNNKWLCLRSRTRDGDGDGGGGSSGSGAYAKRGGERNEFQTRSRARGRKFWVTSGKK